MRKGEKKENGARKEDRRPKLPKVLVSGLLVLGAAGMLSGCAAAQRVERGEVTGSVPATSSVLEERSGEPELQRLREQVLGLEGTAALFMLQSGRTSGGQLQIVMEEISVGGERHVRAAANIADEDLQYHWFVFNEVGGSQLMLSPRHDEGDSQQRYWGIVMRDAILTDGTSGDFVVRVPGNNTTPQGTQEWGPIAEEDGRIAPKNVLFALEPGSLAPQLHGRFSEDVFNLTMLRLAPAVIVREFAPTTAVLIARQR